MKGTVKKEINFYKMFKLVRFFKIKSITILKNQKVSVNSSKVNKYLQQLFSLRSK